MMSINWKLSLRQDQCEFIIAIADHIINRCDERIKGVSIQAFDKFTAKAAQDRAVEIKNYIEEIIG